MNTAKKPEQIKNTENTTKNPGRNQDRDNAGLLQELSILAKSKKKGIIRIDVDSRRR